MTYNLTKYGEIFSTDKVDTSLDIRIGFVAVNEQALGGVLENKITWNTDELIEESMDVDDAPN